MPTPALASKRLASALQELEQIAAFLEDHPGVELYHKNYRKLPAARKWLRSMRLALRELRRASYGNVKMRTRLGAMDELMRRNSANLENMQKTEFRHFIDSLTDEGDHLNLGASSPILPALPRLPKGTPTWVRKQLTADHEEIQRCLSVGADRAAIAFSARMLECVLGHRYFLRQRVDPISQGWTLGRLVTESKNRGVLKDVVVPGADLVLQWLNRTRVASIHVKQKVYRPRSKDAKLICELVLNLLPDLLAP